METRIRDLGELQKEAERLVTGLAPRDGSATLITLSGELGAGKTAFTKGLAKALGVAEVVNSPTFVLEKIYSLEGQPFKRLMHIDAYRLEKGTDLGSLGFDEAMKDSNNLIVLEWPEMVAEALPKAHKALTLRAVEDGSRTITYA